MLVIPVYPLVLVGIIVLGLFSFAIWLMCYESVINKKLIATTAASNSTSTDRASPGALPRLIRGRERQQITSTVSARQQTTRTVSARQQTTSAVSARQPTTSAVSARQQITSTVSARQPTANTGSFNSAESRARSGRGDVTTTDAGVRSTLRTPFNSRTVQNNVTSRNATRLSATLTQGNRVIGEGVWSYPPTGQNNAAFVTEGERDEQREIHGEVVGLPSYSEAVRSGTCPDLDAPPRYEDLMDLD